MTVSLAIITGAELIQSIAGALQIFDANDVLIPPSNIAPYAVVGAPRPSATRLIVSLVADLALAPERTTKFKLVLPSSFGNPELPEIARWQPFCSINPANASTAAQMASSQVYTFLEGYDPIARVVTAVVTAGAPGTSAELSLSFDFKHSIV